MAANQRRKRLNSANILDCNPKERSRLKKKNLILPQTDLNFKSHISLEWDGSKRSVVAKREQIGLSWRDLKQFVKSMIARPILADVFNIPQEILKLENLKEVLSDEVWQNCLSESERSHLMQFLPGGLEKEVVKSLFAGENFHFGNPFLEWSASVCSGNRHPDVVLRQEQSLQVNRNAYCLELQSYHNNMIGYLLKLKESCRNGKDPEKEILERIWRSRNDVDRRVCSQEKECNFDDLDDSVIATSESDSWAADEIACSSDNLISSVMKRGLTKRRFKKELAAEKFGNSLIFSDDLLDVEGREVKGETLYNGDSYGSDGAKYMSYFKISKKQHELIKNIKLSGRSIHVSSLDQVLGNMNLFHVRPYELFVEEEQKNLHEHWLQLVKAHLPVAYANRREIYLSRRKLIHSLAQELKNNQKVEDPYENADNKGRLLQIWKEKHVSENQSLLENGDKYCPCPPNNPFLAHVSADCEINPLDPDSENYETLVQCGYSGNLKSRDITVSKAVPLPPDGDVWPARILHSYFDSSASQEYESANNLSGVHSRVGGDLQKQSIALESNTCGGHHEKSFDSYQNQDRSELLHSLFTSHGGLSHCGEGKPVDLNLQQPNSILAENSDYLGQFPRLPFSSLPEQNRDEIYMQQNVPENMYAIPRQEYLSPVNMQNWDMSSVRMSTLLQNPSIGRNLSAPNWFSGENFVCGGSVSGQIIGNGSSSDQSLFSVLSQSNHSVSSFHSVGPTEWYIAPGIGMVLPRASHPFDYLGGHEAPATLMPDDMGLIGSSDPTEKPYLRSWNK